MLHALVGSNLYMYTHIHMQSKTDLALLLLKHIYNSEFRTIRKGYLHMNHCG